MSAADNLGPMFVNAFHAAPRFHRKSIEAQGIQPSENSMDEVPGEQLFPEGHTKGAFFFQNPKDLEYYVGEGSRDSDIWHGTVPLEHTYQDPFLEDADYTTQPIVGPRRVGHVAEDGIHWHPEETCPQCRGN